MTATEAALALCVAEILVFGIVGHLRGWGRLDEPSWRSILADTWEACRWPTGPAAALVVVVVAVLICALAPRHR